MRNHSIVHVLFQIPKYLSTKSSSTYHNSTFSLHLSSQHFTNYKISIPTIYIQSFKIITIVFLHVQLMFGDCDHSVLLNSPCIFLFDYGFELHHCILLLVGRKEYHGYLFVPFRY